STEAFHEMGNASWAFADLSSLHFSTSPLSRIARKPASPYSTRLLARWIASTATAASARARFAGSRYRSSGCLRCSLMNLRASRRGSLCRWFPPFPRRCRLRPSASAWSGPANKTADTSTTGRRSRDGSNTPRPLPPVGYGDPGSSRVFSTQYCRVDSLKKPGWTRPTLNAREAVRRFLQRLWIFGTGSPEISTNPCSGLGYQDSRSLTGEAFRKRFERSRQDRTARLGPMVNWPYS